MDNKEIFDLLQAFLKSYYIVKIFTIDEVIKIGVGGISQKNIELSKEGFLLIESDNIKWYSFNFVKKLEGLGVKV